MSNGVVGFALDFDRLERFWGCRAPVMLDRLLRRLPDADIDEEDQEEALDEGEERPPTIREAFEHIAMGMPLKGEFPQPYCVAVLGFCHAEGLLLPNDALFGAGWELISAVDGALRKYGYREPVQLSTVLMRGIPVLGLGTPDDCPTVGYLTPQEVAAAPFMGQMWAGPEDVCAAMYEFAGWVEEAKSRCRGLVGFHF